MLVKYLYFYLSKDCVPPLFISEFECLSPPLRIIALISAFLNVIILVRLCSWKMLPDASNIFSPNSQAV